MTDDTIGWTLCGVWSGSSGTFNFATVLSSVGVPCYFGRCLHGRAYCHEPGFAVGGRLYRRGSSWFIGFANSIVGAALTHNLGLEAALGAFVLGILAGQSRRFSREASHTLKSAAGF